MNRAAAVAIGLLALSLILAGPAVAEEDDEITVVAIGDSDAVLAANAIASDHGYDVVHVDEMNPETQQALKQRGHSAIVVGGDASQVDVPVVDTIQGDLLSSAAVQQWDESETAYVTTVVSQRNGVVAAHHDGPVLYESSYESELEYLGVQTVYVDESVSNETISDLEQDYTVKTSLNGVPLEGTPETLSRAFVDDPKVAMSTEYVGLVSDGFVVGESENATYGIGVDSGTELTKLQLYGLSADRGIAVSSVSTDGSTVHVTIENIGSDPIPVVGGESVEASWTGLIENSDPAGEYVDDEYRVSFDEPLEPRESFEVELDVQEVDNGGHPELDYYVEQQGGFVGSSSSIDLPGIDYTVSLWWILLIAATAAVLTTIGALRARDYFKQ